MREFGTIIPQLKIHGKAAPYRVLNERDARAAAGIMFVLGAFAFANAFFAKNFIYLQTFVILFTIEFATRVLLNPHYAPIYALGRLLVKNQIPEYSGAIQKKFAWSLGLGLASLMFIVAIILQIRGSLPFIICSIYLILLWAETSLGVCIGCKMYAYFVKLGWIKEKVKPACPGGVCQVKQ